MTQPASYDPSTIFAEDEAGGVSGRGTIRTAQLDAELASIAESVNQIIENLAVLQRDDTALRDGIVTVASLSAAVSSYLTAAGGNVRGGWVTSTAYVVKDVVTQGTGTYICALPHTAGVFATDLAAGRWITLWNSASFTAASTSFIPFGSIVANNVQAALQELDTDLTALTTRVGRRLNAKDLGAVGDGVTDDYNAHLTIKATAVALGGADVYWPPGTYAMSQTVRIGNGTASADSTENGVVYYGASSGFDGAASSADTTGATRFLYTGVLGGTAVEIAGPCRNNSFYDIQIDGNDLAGKGLRVVHNMGGCFDRAFVRRWRTLAYELTTVAGAPAGVFHGCSDNTYINSGCLGPTLTTASAMLIDGLEGGTSPLGWDATRNLIMLGAYAYGGAAGSYGIKFRYADNNTLINPCVIRGVAGSTDDILFEQFSADVTFPKENHFYGIVRTYNIAGTSGTSGNLFLSLPLDDAGGALPTLPAFLMALTNRGQFVGSQGTGNPWSFETTDAAGTAVRINRPTASLRALEWATNSSKRWQIGANAVAESGANAGSNFIVARYDDAGVLLGTSININRSDGNVKIDEGIQLLSTTAIPAGGSTGRGYRFSSTSNFGVFFGSGAPSLSAAQGSLYLRSDGNATNNRAYINTNGGTTWTAITTVA